MTVPEPDMSANSNAPERPAISSAGRDIDSVAAEHVVQGLLEFQNRGDIAAKGRRVQRVLESLGGASSADGSTARGEAHPPAVYSFKRVARWALPVAAVIGLGTALVFLGVPGESSALAEVRKTIAAMQAPGERRYEIHAVQQADDGGVDRPNAIVDSSGDLLLIRHSPPWHKDKSSYAFCGRDAKGPWVILDGAIIRDNPERYWPPYITDGGEAFMLASVGAQLDQLPDRFTFERLANAPIDAAAGAGGAGAKMFERIAATRKTTAGPLPTHVDLWIDPATHLVERVEYHWNASPSGGGESGGGNPGTSGHDDHGSGGPPNGDDRRPPGPGGPHGPPPDDDDGDRPPPAPDGDGPGGHHGSGEHGHGGHGGPDDDKGGPPPPQDGRGGSGGIDGPGGPGGGSGHAGPTGGKPRLLVFQRVDAPPFPAGWFDPQTHIGVP